MALRLLVLEPSASPAPSSLPPLMKTTKVLSPRLAQKQAWGSRLTSPGSLSYRTLPKDLGQLGLRQSLKEQTQRELVRTLRHGRALVLEARGPRHKPALLEVLEAKWQSMPERWSLERKVLECTLNPPGQIHALSHPIPQPLIVYLSHSPIGRKVLSEALAQMSTTRLDLASNGARITEALRTRSISSIQGFAPSSTKRKKDGKSRPMRKT